MLIGTLDAGPVTYNLVLGAARRDGTPRAVEAALQIFLASDSRARSKVSPPGHSRALASLPRIQSS